MDDLHITLIQSDIFWEDSLKNIEHFGSMIDALPVPTELIVLPEMFNTGFSTDPHRCAEMTDGPAIGFLREKSAEGNRMIVGSIMTGEGGSCFNRLICMRPDGTFDQYDKRHLFRLSEEYNTMKSGRTKTIVNWRGWNILPLVCYDLRFPVWSRNTWSNGNYAYDILLYVANWPKSRSNIWKSLLIARAIENQCYVIGVNWRQQMKKNRLFFKQVFPRTNSGISGYHIRLHLIGIILQSNYKTSSCLNYLLSLLLLTRSATLAVALNR